MSENKNSKTANILMIITIFLGSGGIIGPIYQHFKNQKCPSHKDIIGYVKIIDHDVQYPLGDAIIEILDDGAGRTTSSTKDGKFTFEKISKTDSLTFSIRKNLKEHPQVFKRKINFCKDNESILLNSFIMDKGTSNSDEKYSIDKYSSNEKNNNIYHPIKKMASIHNDLIVQIEVCRSFQSRLICTYSLSKKIPSSFELCANDRSWTSVILDKNNNMIKSSLIEITSGAPSKKSPNCLEIKAMESQEIKGNIYFDGVLNGIKKLEIASTFGILRFDF